MQCRRRRSDRPAPVQRFVTAPVERPLLPPLAACVPQRCDRPAAMRACLGLLFHQQRLGAQRVRPGVCSDLATPADAPHKHSERGREQIGSRSVRWKHTPSPANWPDIVRCAGAPCADQVAGSHAGEGEPAAVGTESTGCRGCAMMVRRMPLGSDARIAAPRDTEIERAAPTQGGALTGVRYPEALPAAATTWG
jgi:hypothetical protein